MEQLGYPDTKPFFSDKLGYILKHPDYYLIGYTDEGQLLGFIILHVIFELGLEGNTALIAYLVVDETHRSKGIGERLEKEAILLAKRRDCVRMQLHCSEHRIKAHKFYERIGYTKYPEYFSKAI